MAAQSRRDTAPLKERLFSEPAGFEFFQAVRLMYKLRGGMAPVGGDADPGDEAIRFRSSTDFSFPPGDLRAVKAREPGGVDELVVNFMGVASPGSFGSLPVAYTEEIHRQERDFKNPALREFLDLFNHRLVSLFYRAWERSRPQVLHDLGRPSTFEAALRAVVGLEGEGLDGRLPFDDRALLSRSGLLAMRPAPALAIEAVVESLFEIPAVIEQFVAAWYDIDPADRSRLGAANARLGVDLNLGTQICLAQPTFRVRVGPMAWERFESLLPGTEGFRMLSSVVRLAAGVEFDFQFRLVLEAEDVPETRLGGDAVPSRLGRTTWLRTQPFERDADDALFEPSLLLESPPAPQEERT
jgi:type VI secretion system protein ImpH